MDRQLIVKQLMLQPQESIDGALDALAPQMEAGNPVQIWRGDGITALCFYDPDHILLGSRLAAIVNSMGPYLAHPDELQAYKRLRRA